MEIFEMGVSNYNIRRLGGFSLIEVMLAITLFAIAVPTIGHLFATAFKEESETSLQTQAVFLATSLMDEISQRRYRESASFPGNGVDAGEESGNDRRNFDDIDDYDIYQTKWGALSPPLDESGASLSNYSKFSQTVDVFNVTSPTSGPSGRDDYVAQSDGTTPFKVVKVSITWDANRRNVTLYKVFALH